MVRLDEVSNALVDLAREEFNEFLANAHETATRRLEQRLEPVRQKYAKDAVLDLSQDEQGYFLTGTEPVDEPVKPKRKLSVGRKRK